jgi:hypothetical protein
MKHLEPNTRSASVLVDELDAGVLEGATSPPALSRPCESGVADTEAVTSGRVVMHLLRLSLLSFAASFAGFKNLQHCTRETSDSFGPRWQILLLAAPYIHSL